MSLRSGVPASPVLRVAIVGLGPKGTYALERLLDHVAAAGVSLAIEVDAFEPYPVPGSGPNYDPGQPEYLRMNFAAEQIDMWGPESAAVPAAERQSFLAWRHERGDPLDPLSYPSRASVGEYLADGLARLLDRVPPGAEVRVRPETVEGLSRRGSGWELATAASSQRYDEVLIATGHEPSWDEGLGFGWEHAAPLLPAVFPVQTRLSQERAAAGAVVAVRGFALSFIDAALALTEGRGGGFEQLDRHFGLRYLPGEGETGPILPFSRSGRPMLAKPSGAAVADPPALERVASHGRERILELAPGFGLSADLLPIVASIAGSSLLIARRRRPTGEQLRLRSAELLAVLVAASQGVPPPVAEGPAEELARSLSVGLGMRAPDRDWALGHAWRALYPALVTCLGGDRMCASERGSFRRLAAQMERISFGPSPQNAAKLLALVAARRIDLTHVRGGRLRTRAGLTALCSGQGECVVDVVLDAVQPGPGVCDGGGGLLPGLLNDGHVRVREDRRGVEVDEDGSCVDGGGALAPGLAAVGRPTEDWVVGNDTLDRKLHSAPDRWAQRVVRRCRDETAAAPRSSRRDAIALGAD